MGKTSPKSSAIVFRFILLSCILLLLASVWCVLHTIISVCIITCHLALIKKRLANGRQTSNLNPVYNRQGSIVGLFVWGFFLSTFSFSSFFSTLSLSLSLSHTHTHTHSYTSLSLSQERKSSSMLYLPPLPTLLVLLWAAEGGVLAAPREAASIQAPLDLTLPPIPSDPYMQTDYIDKNKTPVRGSGSKIEFCSIPPLIDHKSLVCCCFYYYSF